MTTRALILLGVLASARVAHAQAVAAEPPTTEITVRGAPPRPAAAAGDYRLKIGQLIDVPRTTAEQLLTVAPGVLITNHGGQYHASAVFLRGFDAGEGQDLEFTVEGVPINEPSNPHGHGYADTHFVIPELVSELRVLQGPYDPRQGDFAVAGSVAYKLALPQRGALVKGGWGSFDRRRALVAWGPQGSSARTFAALDIESGEGFGPNRAFASARLAAQHEIELDPRTRVTLLLTSHANRFDQAGVIRRDDYLARRLPCGGSRDEQFFCLYDRNQGGVGSRHVLSATLERVHDHGTSELQSFLSLRSLRLRANFTGYVNDVSAEGLPQRGDGVEQTYDALTLGGRASHRVLFGDGALLREIELGLFVRHDQGEGAQRRLRTEAAVPYRVDLDDRLRISNLGGYVSARLAPLRRLALTGGIRVDAFQFAVTDRNRPTSDRSGARLGSEASEAFGFSIQPKLGAQVTLGRGWRALASFGVGTRSSHAQALSDGEFAPFARVQALETGASWNRSVGDELELDGRIIAFHTHVTRDLVFDESVGRNTLAGASNRFGVQAALRATTMAGFDLLASATYSEAYLPPAGQNGFAFASGTRLPYIPRWVARSDASWRRPFVIWERLFELNLASGFTFVAKRPLPYEQLAPVVATLDAAIRIATGPVQLGLEATNLLDRRNREAVFNYASNFRGPTEPPSRLPQQHFTAAPPRQVFLTLTYQPALRGGR